MSTMSRRAQAALHSQPAIQDRNQRLGLLLCYAFHSVDDATGLCNSKADLGLNMQMVWSR